MAKESKEEHKGPVYMLVIGTITDREKMAQYQKALKDSGLYPENGGYYIAAGRPIDQFEEEWPDDQGMVMAKFPSLDHARKFWNSDVYQNEIKPLRDGAGTFVVSVFPDVAEG